MGSADITEGAQDIYYGNTGNTGTASFNPVRDTLFGGNQQNYNSFEFAAAGSCLGLGAYSSGVLSMPILSGNVAKYANILGGAGEMLDSAGDIFDYIGDVFENSRETTMLYRVMSEAEFESLMITESLYYMIWRWKKSGSQQHKKMQNSGQIIFTQMEYIKWLK